MLAQQPIATYNGKPQLEDGYTRIANELLQAIILFKFTERQYKVFFAILRKTYGFNKTSDEISLSQLSTLCNLPVNHVSTVINQLVKLNVIIKNQGKHAHNLMINKQYDTWGLHNVECHKEELHIMDLGVTSLGVKGLHNVEVQKTTPKDNTKDNIAEVKTSTQITFKKYLENCKLNNIQPLPDDCIVFKNAEKLGIDEVWLKLCWLKFKEYYLNNHKRQSNWIATFNNCVKDNWYKIWFMDNNNKLALSSQGKIALEFYKDEI
jgi:phage replication O-like protein O